MGRRSHDRARAVDLIQFDENQYNCRNDLRNNFNEFEVACGVLDISVNSTKAWYGRWLHATELHATSRVSNSCRKARSRRTSTLQELDETFQFCSMINSIAILINAGYTVDITAAIDYALNYAKNYRLCCKTCAGGYNSEKLSDAEIDTFLQSALTNGEDDTDHPVVVQLREYLRLTTKYTEARLVHATLVNTEVQLRNEAGQASAPRNAPASASLHEISEQKDVAAAALETARKTRAAHTLHTAFSRSKEPKKTIKKKRKKKIKKKLLVATKSTEKAAWTAAAEEALVAAIERHGRDFKTIAQTCKVALGGRNANSIRRNTARSSRPTTPNGRGGWSKQRRSPC
eukprot:COSAG02_NODE_5711_length_4103_cov_8.928367_2_plen_345_part_00